MVIANNNTITHIIMAISAEQLESMFSKLSDDFKKQREEAEERFVKRKEDNLARYEAAQAKSDAVKKRANR